MGIAVTPSRSQLSVMDSLCGKATAQGVSPRSQSPALAKARCE